MLVLTRKVGEEVVIGDNITLVIHRISGNRVTVGISAPGDVRIVRGELEPVARGFGERPVESAVRHPHPGAFLIERGAPDLVLLPRQAR